MNKNTKLFIFDRQEDILSPLMFSWSYFSLIIELTDYNEGIVSIDDKEKFNLNAFYD